jgi:hypothetical protein
VWQSGDHRQRTAIRTSRRARPPAPAARPGASGPSRSDGMRFRH